MNLFHLNSDILISLLSEWIVSLDLVELDNSLTNKNHRDVYLSILKMRECVLSIVPNNHRVVVLDWIKLRQCHVKCIEFDKENSRTIANHLLSENRVGDVQFTNLSSKWLSNIMLLQQFPNLVTINFERINFIEDSQVETIVSNLPHKERLTQVSFQSVAKLTCRSLQSVSVHCPNIRKMALTFGKYLEAVEGVKVEPFKSLEEIIIEECGKYSLQATAAVLSYTKKLKYVYLTGNVLQLIKYPENIETIRIFGKKEADVLKFVAKTPNVVDVIFFGRISTEGYRQIGVCCPKIHTIEIDSLTDELSALFASVKGIKTINCKVTNRISCDDSLDSLFKSNEVSQLTSFMLSGFVENHDILCCLIQKFANLESIHLNVATKELVLLSIGTFCPLLKHLWVLTATNNGIEGIIRECPKIESIQVNRFEKPEDHTRILEVVSQYGQSLYTLTLLNANIKKSSGFMALSTGCPNLRFFAVRTMSDSTNALKDLKKARPGLRIQRY